MGPDAEYTVHTNFTPSRTLLQTHVIFFIVHSNVIFIFVPSKVTFNTSMSFLRSMDYYY